MKKLSALLFTLLLLVSLSACGSSATSDSANYSTDTDTNAPEMKSETAGAIEDQAYTGMTESQIMTSVNSPVYQDADAKIIRTAWLTIQTLDFDQSVLDLASLTEKYGGYYETAQVDSGGYYNQGVRRSAYYEVRVPRENFVAFREAVGTVGYLYSFSEDSKDVGEEYYDTEARLATLTTKRERLLSLLDKAELMEDIISLEDALAEVQYEIDMHTSTLRKYDSLINYSTFTVTLDEVFKIVEEPDPQEGFGVMLAANLKEGMESFGDSLQSFAFWLARNLITLIVLAAVIVAGVKIVMIVRKKRRTPPET